MFVCREHKYIIVDRLSGLLYGRFWKEVTANIIPKMMKNIICRMAIIPHEIPAKYLHETGPGSHLGRRGVIPLPPSFFFSGGDHPPPMCRPGRGVPPPHFVVRGGLDHWEWREPTEPHNRTRSPSRPTPVPNLFSLPRHQLNEKRI